MPKINHFLMMGTQKSMLDYLQIHLLRLFSARPCRLELYFSLEHLIFHSNGQKISIISKFETSFLLHAHDCPPVCTVMMQAAPMTPQPSCPGVDKK